MIDASPWKEYCMSGPERDYLDRYLSGLKEKTDPSSPDDTFFARFCIAQILKPKDLDIDQLSIGYTDGPLDGGVDAIYFFVAGRMVTDEWEPSEVADYEELAMGLHLIQATRSPSFSTEQIRKLEDFSKDLLDTRNDVDAKARQYNDDVRTAIRRFRTWWQALNMKLPSLSIHFHIASKADTVHPDVALRGEALKQTVKTFFPCDTQVHFLNAKTLLEMAKKSRRDPVELKFTKHLGSDQWGNAFVCLVQMCDYIKLITTPTGELRDYVLEPNVRGYLGHKGVNAEIRNTLSAGSSKKEEFWWLNNGVTITASKITPQISSLVLKDARVVNGLQTSREIYHYSLNKARAAKSDERHILVKVVEADKKSSRNITKTTNNQTRVEELYLRTTTDDIHDMIEAAMPDFGYYYERVKNQYYDDDKERSKIVTLDYLTRSLVAILMQHPEQARGSPKQFVQRHYNKIFNPRSKPEVFGHTVKLMKLVDQFVESRVEGKTHRANLKYYVGLDAICSVSKKSSIRPSTIVALKLEKLTPAVLEGSLMRVKRIYDDLLAKGIVPDLVAKGGDFIAELKKDLEGRFPPKHGKGQPPPMWSAMEQGQ
jgi:hypothetical protein